jgi:hypothetical protein
MAMCRPCGEALKDARTALGEVIQKLNRDEYCAKDAHRDVQCSLLIIASMAYKMGLPEIDEDLKTLSKLFLCQLEPIGEDFS